MVRDTTKSKEKKDFRELYEKEKKKAKKDPPQAEAPGEEKSTKH